MYKSILLTLLLAGLTLTTQAQQALSLGDAISLGLANNYDLRIESTKVEKANLNNNRGEAGALPSLDVQINPGYNLTDNIKTAFPTQTQGQIKTNSIAPILNLNWTLFDGFRVRATSQRLKELERESKGNATIIVANTLESIILGYYKAVLEQERLQVVEQNLALSRERYRLAKLKVDMGSSSTSDMLLEEGNYLSDSANLINQELTYRNSLRSLNFLMAVQEPNTRWVLTDGLEIEAELYQYSDLHEKMLSSNVDVRKQYIHQAVLAQELKIARAGRYPTLSLTARASDTYQWLDLSGATFFTGEGFETGPEEVFNSETRNYDIGFTLSYNLYNGGRIKRAIQQAVLDQDMGNMELDRLKASLSRDLANSFDQYSIRRTLYGINQRKQDAAETNLKLSNAKFSKGTINSFDFRVVQIALLQANIDELQSVYNLLESKVAIMRLTGGLIEEYQPTEEE